jgi:putative MATE family efflux protein
MEKGSRTSGVVRDFTQGPVTRQLLLFSAPLFLSNVLQIAYNMVDMLVVGHFVGSAGISAVSVGGEVTNFLTVFAMGLSNAGSVIVAQYLGAGQRDKVGRFIGTLFTFLMGASILMAAIGLGFTDQILTLMHTPAEAWDGAKDYATVCMSGLLFIYGYNMVSAVLRGVGDSKRPFLFVGIAAVINTVLDLVFVALLDMGVFGAALATVIGQTTSFLISVVFLVRNRTKLGFSLKGAYFRIEVPLLLTLLKLGIPMAIKQGAVSISKLFVSSWVNSFGVEVSAVAGIGNKITLIANMFSNATNTAGSTMVGQNIGAEQYQRVPKVVASVFSITAVTSALMGIVIFLWPEQVFGLFNQEPAVLAVAMDFVPVALAGMVSCPLRSASNALINGAGNYKVNFAVALLDGIVLRLGLSVLFGLWLGWGYQGFWWGDAIAGFTPFVIGIFFYASGSWKTRKYVVK